MAGFPPMLQNGIPMPTGAGPFSMASGMMGIESKGDWGEEQLNKLLVELNHNANELNSV